MTNILLLTQAPWQTEACQRKRLSIYKKKKVNKLSLVKSSDFMKFILYLFKAAKQNSKNQIGQCWTVNLWNNLESFLKLSPSVKILKCSLRSQLLDNFLNTF